MIHYYKRVKRHHIETLTKQTHPNFFNQPTDRAVAISKVKELENKGYDAIWFEENKENERIYIWGRRLKDAPESGRTRGIYHPCLLN